MSIFIEPKNKPNVPFNYVVNHETSLIYQEYSNYTGYSIDELLTLIADKLLDDPKFVDYFSSKRANKKIMAIYEKHQSNITDITKDGFETIEVDDKGIPFK